MNKSSEHARLLMEKATEDIYTIQRLAPDAGAPMAVIGFHAQQAVEKCLKAVLTSRAVHYTRTHDIAGLLNLLRKNGISEPPMAGQLATLTPFAADLRYDRLPPEGDEGLSLDRTWVVDCVTRTKAWAESLLSGN